MGFLSLCYRQRQEDRPPPPPPMVCSFSHIPAAALSKGREAFARRSRRLSKDLPDGSSLRGGIGAGFEASDSPPIRTVSTVPAICGQATNQHGRGGTPKRATAAAKDRPSKKKTSDPPEVTMATTVTTATSLATSSVQGR
ncbi:hypothetical protein LY76DRAFT_672072 [Colletotrichum caudatum]|nr:hypothetical protein LY76DRAFT_672072 [Colletotrichum caudatum]